MSQENSTDLRDALASVGKVPRESIKVEVMQAYEAETQWAVFKENRNEMVTTFGLKQGI